MNLKTCFFSTYMDANYLPACAYETFTVVDFSDYEELTFSSKDKDPLEAFIKDREKRNILESDKQTKLDEMEKLLLGYKDINDSGSREAILDFHEKFKHLI